MKTKDLITVASFFFFVSQAAFGQHEHHPREKKDVSSDAMLQTMGKPTFERSVDGIRIQLWLTGQEEHKGMMSEQVPVKPESLRTGEKDTMDREKTNHKMMCGGIKETNGKMGMMHDHGKPDKKSEMMEEGMMESMLAGTHHIMAAVLDESSRKEIENAEVEIQTISPSEKTSTLELMSMRNHFCGGLALKEEGKYEISAHIKIEGKTLAAHFEYEVE